MKNSNWPYIGGKGSGGTRCELWGSPHTNMNMCMREIIEEGHSPEREQSVASKKSVAPQK